VAKAARELAAEKKPGDEGYYIRRANADEFARLRLLVPSQEAAESFLNWLTEDTKEHKRRLGDAERMAERDQLSIHHLRLLATAKAPALRRLVLAPIRLRPTPARRAVLQTLLDDNDDAVRAEAKQVQAGFEKTLAKPLPSRDVP
jgi:hypothetical protein